MTTCSCGALGHKLCSFFRHRQKAARWGLHSLLRSFHRLGKLRVQRRPIRESEDGLLRIRAGGGRSARYASLERVTVKLGSQSALQMSFQKASIQPAGPLVPVLTQR